MQVARENAERERLERVSGEERHRFAERYVARRLAASQRVVIHAWKIVVDQRVRVYELDRGCRGVHRVGIRARELAARVYEERSHPLSAIEHRVAHRATQRLGIEVRGR